MKRNMALMALTGVLTLASCGTGPTPTPTDTTAPTVSLTATPTSGTAPQNITLTANASDNVAVKEVQFYRGGTLINTDTTAPYTYVDNGVAAGTYVYTAKAIDTAATANMATSNSVNVTLTAASGGGGVVLPDGSLQIVSPANGAAFQTGQTARVTFNQSGLSNIQCSYAGGAAVNASVSSTGGYCDVILTGTGSKLITVTGTAGNGQTVTQTVVVDVAAVAQPAGSAITFDANQRISNGVDRESGWRDLSQVVSTPGNPDPSRDIYVRGKDLNVSFTNPSGAGRVEVFVARTTGTDVPTNDNILAADKLVEVNAPASGVVVVDFDTTTLSQYEGVRQWIVFRVNDTTLYYRPVVSDNQAPQPAYTDFTRANNANSNTIPEPTDPSIIWARGQIEIFTTNTDLQDLPYGQAPAGASFDQLRPAGLESIEYYLVPEAAAGVAGVSDADLTRRAKAIQAISSAVSTGPVYASTNTVNGVVTTDYRATIDSSAAGLNLNGAYRIYAITRDKLGNEVASPSYDRVNFDNIGPVVGGANGQIATICDISALPFVSVDPCNIISDYAALSLGTLTDNPGGVGLGTTNGLSITLGNTTLFANGGPIAPLEDIEGVDGVYFLDTNLLSDGVHTFNYSGVTDLLGNPVQNAVAVRNITIDNTDPSLDLTRPLNAQVVSGDIMTLNARATDTGSGVFQNVVLWDDSQIAETIYAGGFQREFSGLVDGPVEAGRKTADDRTQRLTELTNNQRAVAPWVSPTDNEPIPGATPALIDNVLERQTFYAVGIVSDRAGNATMHRVPVTVKPKHYDLLGRGNLTAPRLGAFDGFNQSLVPNLVDQFYGNEGIFPANENGTVLNFAARNGTNRHNLSLAAPGTYSENVFSTANEPLKSINNYGVFAQNDWDTVVGYLLGDPTFAQETAITAAEDARDAAVANLIAVIDAAQAPVDDNIATVGVNEAQVQDFISDVEQAAIVAAGAVAADLTAALNPDRILTDAEQGTVALEAGTIVAGAYTTTFTPLYDAAVANFNRLYSDPSLLRGDAGDNLASSRETQGWEITNTPWLKIGETMTPDSSLGGRYTTTTNGLNNLYWGMLDSEAASYPTGAPWNLNGTGYSWLSAFSGIGLDGTYDALAGLAMDNAGSYNIYGECYATNTNKPVNTYDACIQPE